jgi:hypothetical protein
MKLCLPGVEKTTVIFAVVPDQFGWGKLYTHINYGSLVDIQLFLEVMLHGIWSDQGLNIMCMLS